VKNIAERYNVVRASDIYLEGGGHYRIEVHERIWLRRLRTTSAPGEVDS